MDLQSTITSIATNTAQHVIHGASDYIPEALADVIRHAYSYFPAEINFEDAAQFGIPFPLCILYKFNKTAPVLSVASPIFFFSIISPAASNVAATYLQLFSAFQ